VARSSSADDLKRLERLNERLARLLDGHVLDSLGRPVDDRTADRILVSVASAQLHELLAGRRRHGLEGWHVRKGRNAKLLAELLEAAHGGRWRDVIRLAAVLVAREHLYGPDA
jgi:hypothetical protein